MASDLPQIILPAAEVMIPVDQAPYYEVNSFQTSDNQQNESQPTESPDDSMQVHDASDVKSLMLGAVRKQVVVVSPTVSPRPASARLRRRDEYQVSPSRSSSAPVPGPAAVVDGYLEQYVDTKIAKIRGIVDWRIGDLSSSATS
jgi:hypothetical protein